MQRKCREIAAPTWRRRQQAATELLRHAKVVTDSNRLAYLKAEAAKWAARTEGDLGA
jgi:hypothetical protein